MFSLLEWLQDHVSMLSKEEAIAALNMVYSTANVLEVHAEKNFRTCAGAFWLSGPGGPDRGGESAPKKQKVQKITCDAKGGFSNNTFVAGHAFPLCDGCARKYKDFLKKQKGQ